MSLDEEFTVSFSCLERGRLYPIKNIERTQSVFNGRQVNGVKVTILDDDVELVTYLPSKLVRSLDNNTIEEVKTAGMAENKFNVCYYGQMKKSMITEFYGRIHSPNEGRLEKLFNDLGKIMEKFSPLKRKNEDDDSPSKRKKEDA